MIINDAGTYTLKYTATDSCGKSTTVDRELVVAEPVHIYGAEWDGSSSPVWTRTDESANFANPSPAVNNGTGSSPFDDLMPWSGMQIVEDADAGTLVSIPKFYYKWTRFGTANEGMKLQISTAPQEGFLTSPAHADRGDGVGERDVVYVGKYHCATDTMKSETNKMPKVRTTISDARNSISGLGSDIWQYDFAMYWTIAMLYLVEFANWDSQGMIGYGCTGVYMSVEQNGLTDSMQYHTGTNAETIETYGEVQYRHIEGLWSGAMDWLDGIYFSSSDGVNTRYIHIVKNPSDFETKDNNIIVEKSRLTSGSNIIRKFTYPTVQGGEYALFPALVAPSSDTYVCDGYSSNSNYTNASAGMIWTRKKTGGLFRIDTFIETGSAEYVGSRLMKLPS